MLEGVLRMADMTAGDVMVAAPRMDLLDIDAAYDELAGRRHPHRALALPGLRGRARQHHRHPDGQGPAEAAALARAEPAHAAAASRLRAGEQASERVAARVPQQPQPPGHRHRRVRQHRRAHHHRGRAGGDRRRDRGRVRRAGAAENGIYTLADGSHRVAGDVAIGAVNEAFGDPPARRATSTPSAASSRTSSAACRAAARACRPWAGCASR
jgi:magnesium and cobalt transporter